MQSQIKPPCHRQKQHQLEGGDSSEIENALIRDNRRHHNARTGPSLPDLHPGQWVCKQTPNSNWTPASIVTLHHTSRSYTSGFKDGSQVQHKHRHIAEITPPGTCRCWSSTIKTGKTSRVLTEACLHCGISGTNPSPGTHHTKSNPPRDSHYNLPWRITSDTNCKWNRVNSIHLWQVGCHKLHLLSHASSMDTDYPSAVIFLSINTDHPNSHSVGSIS